MEFRLVYKGSLPSNGSSQQKQALRREFHRQLRVLWKQRPLADHPAWLDEQDGSNLLHPVGGFCFSAFISTRICLMVELDVLLLRPQEPGRLLGHGGDLDNRMKTLFDSLRVPAASEIPNGDAPGPGEVPFHCVLEDDALISKVAITSDCLLSDTPKGHVELVLHFKTKATTGTWGNIGLA